MPLPIYPISPCIYPIPSLYNQLEIGDGDGMVVMVVMVISDRGDDDGDGDDDTIQVPRSPPPSDNRCLA